MSTTLVINVAHGERRVALIEKGSLSELYIERAAGRGLVGNIYKGKVVRVLPGMDASFVDVALDKAGFLYISDVAKPESPDELGLAIQEGSEEEGASPICCTTTRRSWFRWPRPPSAPRAPG
jgi:ribonuclease G